MEIELQDNNIYNDENNINNDDIYKHSKLSNNPNEYHEDIKPDSAYEDGGIIEKKKYKNKNNWDISTNTEKDNNYIDNNNINNENNIDNDNIYNISNIKKDDENEEKIDYEIPYQSKISDINQENNIKNENDVDRKISDDEKENEGNNDLINDDDENLTSKNENIDKPGMSEKEY